MSKYHPSSRSLQVDGRGAAEALAEQMEKWGICILDKDAASWKEEGD